MGVQQLIYSNAVQAFENAPDKVAVIHKDSSLSYKQLFHFAQNVADNIIEQKITKDLVAVILDKSNDQVIANLGVVLAGCAYFPIDPTWPEQRIKTILKASAAKLIITDNCVLSKYEWMQDYAIIKIEQKQLTEKVKPMNGNGANSSDLAYVIFTSGSTGTPKGVAIEHGSVYNTIDVFNETFSITEADTILSLSPVSFDLSVYDIFGMLNAGGTIVMPDPEKRNDPKCWLEYLDKYDITIWNTAPALGQMLADYVELIDTSNAYVFPKVKLVALGGDWIPLNLPDRLRKIFPNATLMSGGGSTETSIWGCWYIINDVLPNWKSIPYGKAIKGQNMQLFNENFTSCKVGEIGEIFFSGIGLAREYWQAPELTAEKFIFHPETGERFYKSGDLGRLLPDGNIEFISRIDQQVQINGYRVELPEIEKHLASHPNINRAVVLDLKTSNSSVQLAAAVILKNQANITSENIRSYLAQLLPSFMVPNLIMILDEFPLSKHGKIDKLKLKSLFTEKMHSSSRLLLSPENETEKELLSIWKEVLRVDNISTDDTFLSLGGTSILAVIIVAKIELKYSIHLPISLLLSNATVKSISEELILCQKDPNKLEPPILLNKNIYNKNNHHLPLFLMHPGGGTVICYDKLGSAINNRKVYAIEFPYNEVSVVHHTPYFKMEWLADLYAQKIMSVVQGPCIIGGWSAGGAISYATTKRMEKLGHRVPLLIMIDSACANVYREQQDKVAKVNSQAISFYINELNKYFHTPVTLEDLEKNNDFDLSMYLPDLIHFVYEKLDIRNLIKKEIPIGVLERFIFTFEGTVRAGLDVHLTENVEEIFFIKAERSDITTVNGWKPFSRKEIQVYEIPGTTHLSIIEEKHVAELEKIITNYTTKLNI
ncbi:MAG: hypothetical protein Tsb005_14210 [Gammaproteobacteria bacterium]